MARRPIPVSGQATGATALRVPEYTGGGIAGLVRDISVLNTLGLANLLAVAVLIAANIIHMALTFDMFAPGIGRLAIAVEYLLLVIFLGVAVLQAQWRAVALVGAYIAYLVWQAYYFGIVSGLAPNYFAIATLGVLSLPFVFYASRTPANLVLAALALFCSLYVIYYIAAAPTIANYRGLDDVQGVLKADGIRESRAYLASQFAVFVLFLGVAMLRRQPLGALFFIAIAGLALYISQSRFVQAVTLIVLAGALVNVFVPATRRMTAWGLALLSLALSLYCLSGYFDASLNPYEPFIRDASGRARYLQFLDAKAIMSANMWLGVGLPGSVDDLQFFVRPRQPFFYTDLGVSGIAFVFGIPFAFLFLFLSTATALAVPSRFYAEQPLFMALFWTNQSSVVSNFFNVSTFAGSGTLFFGMMLLLWFRGGVLDPIFPRRRGAVPANRLAGARR